MLIVVFRIAHVKPLVNKICSTYVMSLAFAA